MAKNSVLFATPRLASLPPRYFKTSASGEEVVEYALLLIVGKA